MLLFVVLLVQAVQLVLCQWAGPIELSPSTSKLYFSVNRPANQLNLSVTAELPASSTGRAWIGIGLAEATSSGRRGGDVYVAEFKNVITETCLPVNISDVWTRTACSRTNGTLTLNVTRSLQMDTSGNRSVAPGVQNVLHSVRQESGNFSTGWTSTEVVFFNDDGTPVVQPGDKPINSTGSISLIAGPYRSNFMCYLNRQSVEKVGQRVVIAARATVTSANVSRIVVYGCEDSEFFNNFDSLEKCQITSSPFVLGLNLEAKCNTVFYSWSPGVGPLIFPNDVGMPLGPNNRNLVMEVTSSGNYSKGAAIVTLEYTDKPRSMEAGTLAVGDPGYYFEGEVFKGDKTSAFTCSGRCTNYFIKDITIFASHLMSGRHGREITLWKAQEKGSNSTVIQQILNWDSNVQRYRYFNPLVMLRPGESLTTTCTYTSLNPQSEVRFGPRAMEESCMAYLHYWPKRERSDGDGSLFYCGLAYNRAGIRMTLCGAGYKRDRLIAEKDEVPCFPSDATVTLQDGTKREMRDVRIGDRVLVGNGLFSEVFMFTHRNSAAIAKFVQILLADGKSISLTPGHFLYCNGKLVPAGDVRVGDMLHDAGGKLMTVVKVGRHVLHGLYNPQTVQGDIVVDGILASTYTTAVAPAAAHALLAPVRCALRPFAAWGSILFDGESRLRSVGVQIQKTWSRIEAGRFAVAH